MKICWLLAIFHVCKWNGMEYFNQIPFQLISIPRWFLITCSCVSVSVGISRCWCTGVVFVQPGVKVNGAWTTTVMSCCSNSCCQTSIKLLVSFTFQCTTRAQEHRAAVTQDSGLHTRHATCVNMPMTLTLSFLPQIVILGTLSLTKLNYGPATIILN